MPVENLSFLNKTSAAFLEQVANQILKLDGEAYGKLAQFADKVIHIRIDDVKLNFYLSFPNCTLVIQEHSEQKISAKISGKLTAFIAAATAAHSSDAIFTGELSFSGEINTAKQFQDFVQALQIDWQEPLSRTFGDLVAHNISKGINNAGNFIGQFIASARQDIPEYLQHEIQITPSQSELNHFFERVDLSRSQADRLSARIQRLQQSLLKS